MQRWEYCRLFSWEGLVKFYTLEGVREERFDASQADGEGLALARLGDAGWEVVSVTMVAVGSAGTTELIFLKREVTAT